MTNNTLVIPQMTAEAEKIYKGPFNTFSNLNKCPPDYQDYRENSIKMIMKILSCPKAPTIYQS